MGLVLVFDLDETLIATTKTYKDGKYYIDDIKLNEKLFQIIFHAKSLNPDGPVAVDAILLLTNNTNVPSEYRGLRMGFLDIIDLVVKQKYGEGFDEIFDKIYTGKREEVNSGKRTTELVEFRGFGEPIYEASNIKKEFPKGKRLVKDIETVAKILREKAHSTENLEDRIIFFDDEKIVHKIKGELEGHGGKYITIVPPFGKGEDKTVLSPVYDALRMPNQAKGGARRRRTARKKKQLRRTKKYRVKKASY
ncbi:MAG: hypothetical protein EBT07_07935 [Actinobacteria bacterium]|nr:hypothetical protein [Actinomycetota bacterium]